MRSPGGRRASGGSDSIAASLSVKEKNVWLCFLCFVFGGRHHASGSLLFFPLPLWRTHTHPCDHRSMNRISLALFLIEWRAEVILGLTRIFSPSRNICGTYGRRAAVWDSAAASESSSIAAHSIVLVQSSPMFPPQQNFVERKSETPGWSRVTHTLTSKCVSRTLPCD